MVSKVILAQPRGFCAGVHMAIETVKLAHEKYPDETIYVNHQIVHNKRVVDNLINEFGTIFVKENISEIPDGSIIIMSAHGVSPQLYRQAKDQKLRIIDATCPLVDKVHKKAIKYHNKGYEIILIGHKGHQEVIGTQGYAPMHIVGTSAEADALCVKNPNKLAYITQTTLSKDDTQSVVDTLLRRFPNITNSRDDICYATTNRQAAVKALSEQVDLVLVAGENNSSNSNRLVETAISMGTPSHLISSHDKIDPAWLIGVKTVGITSGASTPEEIVEGVIEYFKTQGELSVDILNFKEENVTFKLPKALEDMNA